MDGLANFARGMQALNNFSYTGSFICLIYVIIVFVKSLKGKYFYFYSFIIFIVYYLFVALKILSELENDGYVFAINFLWYIPFIISLIFDFSNKSSRKKGDVRIVIVLGSISLLLITFSIVAPSKVNYWVSDGKYLQAIDKYVKQENYVEAAKICSKKRYNDKLYKLSEKYIPELYEKGKYRDCIDLYDVSVDVIKGMHKYYEKSYESLYAELIIENKLVEAIDLIYEINNSNNLYSALKDTYNQKLYYDLSIIDVLKNIGVNKYVYFGYLKNANKNTKKLMKWYYYKEDDHNLYLVPSDEIFFRSLDNENVDKAFNNTKLYKYLNEVFLNDVFDEEEKILLDNNNVFSLPSIEDLEIINKNNMLNLKSFNRNEIWAKSNIVNGQAYMLSYVVNVEEKMIPKEVSPKEVFDVVPVLAINKNKITGHEYEDAINKKNALFKNDIRNRVINMKKVSDYPETATIKDFDTIKIFSIEGYEDKTEWILLDIVDDKALLLSKYIVRDSSFNYYDINEIKQINWENSSVRRFNEFNISEDWLFIDNLEYKIISKKKNSNKPCRRFNNEFGNDTDDYFFILSIDDINKYFYNGTYKYNDEIQNNNKLKTKTNESLYLSNFDEKRFWVRDAGELWYKVCFVDENGNVNNRGIEANAELGDRLAVWIDIN